MPKAPRRTRAEPRRPTRARGGPSAAPPAAETHESSATPAAPAAPNRTVQSAVLAAGRIFNALVLAAAAIILSRLLPKEEYGSVQQVMAIYAIGAGTLGSSLASAVFAFVPRAAPGPARKGTVLLLGNRLTAAGLLFSALLFLGADALGEAYGNPQRLPLMLRLFAVYATFMIPVFAVDGILLTYRRPDYLVAFNAVTRAGIVAALAVPPALGYSIEVSMAAWAAVGVAQGLWGLRIVRRFVFDEQPGTPAYTPAERRALDRFIVPAVGTAGVGSVPWYIDRWLVSSWYGAAGMAVYANGTIENPLAGVVTAAASPVLTQAFSAHSRTPDAAEAREIAGLWRRANLRVSALTLPASVWLIAVAPTLVRLLFGEGYDEAIPIFRFWAVTTYLQTVLTGPFFVGFGLAGLQFTGMVLSAIISVPALALATSAFGIVGAPAARTAALLVQIAFAFTVARRYVLPPEAGPVVDRRGLARVVGAAAAAGAGAWAVTNALPAPDTTIGRAAVTAASAAVFTVLYVPGAYALGLLRAETALALRLLGRLRRR